MKNTCKQLIRNNLQATIRQFDVYLGDYTSELVALKAQVVK